MTQTPLPNKHQAIPFWRDERFLQLITQLVTLAVVAAGIYWLFNNMVAGLEKQGMTIGFEFLQGTAGFDLGESLIEYSRSSRYIDAVYAGLLNTVVVSLAGIILATIFGIVMGVASISNNLLVNRLSRIYIEILRNIPLLVLLIFWYNGVFLKLPRVKDAMEFPGPIFLSNRGIAVPWGIPTASFDLYITILGIGLLLGAALAAWMIIMGRRSGRTPLYWVWSSLLFLLVAIVGWFILPEAPLTFEAPYAKGLNFAGGHNFSPEFMALLSGLVIYTAAFIAEVVRAGIQAVSHGQTEAARALGLTNFQALRLVIFPQALRVIIPPLTSQYLNLTKNSSLAVAIAYPDLFYASNTVINQSGRAVEMMSIVMLLYLSTSLLTSLFMNWYNGRVRLKER